MRGAFSDWLPPPLGAWQVEQTEYAALPAAASAARAELTPATQTNQTSSHIIERIYRSFSLGECYPQRLMAAAVQRPSL
jgi:hypothetical protein